MRFIHAADVKLGIRPDPSDAEALRRFEEREEDFEKLLDAVRNLKADALFLTGNLFDHLPSQEELDRVDGMFAALDARVFIVPGELDADERSGLVRKRAWKSRTKVFPGDAVDRVFIARWDTEITGVGYTKKYYHLVSNGHVSPGERDALKILLLPFIGESADQPLNAEDPGPIPFDYTGIGQRMAVRGSEEYPLFGPGCFEPEGFSAQMTHGFLVGELSRDLQGEISLSVRMIRNAKREYRILKLPVSWDQRYTAVRAQIRDAVAELGQENIYRIQLEGNIPAELFYRKEELMKLGNITEIEDDWSEERLFSQIRECGAHDLTGKLAELYLDEESGMSEQAYRFALEALLDVIRKKGK